MARMKAEAEWLTLQQAIEAIPPACLGDDRFIQDKSDVKALKEICGTCRLFNECSAYAIKAKPSGYWAGRRYH